MKGIKITTSSREGNLMLWELSGYTFAHAMKGKAKMSKINCAVCGQPCIFVPASGDPDEGPITFGGWYCSPCDAFTETDVEVED